MKLSAFLLTSIAYLASAAPKPPADYYAFKCGTTVYVCNSDEVVEECLTPGVKDVDYSATKEQCSLMIDSITSEDGPFGVNCPKRSISNYAIKREIGFEKCDDKGCEPCKPQGKPGNGGSGGDPHFRTFDGSSYSFHGECDLVLARSPLLDLDLHIRTKNMGTWSVISNVALRVGNEILEFDHDGSHFINGSPAAMEFDLAGLYHVTKEDASFEHQGNDGKAQITDKHVILVDLGGAENIKMTLMKDILYVRVNAHFADTEGLLGIHGMKGMIGRDRVSVLQDPNEMGFQWQVNSSEPMLFREARAPQFPDTCKLPSVSADNRRLGQSAAELQRAEIACAGVDDFSHHFCIEDVLLTNDIHAAKAYVFGDAF